MAERFHVNCPLAAGPVTLAGPEAHHLATVCRMRPGDAVTLFNGDGREDVIAREKTTGILWLYPGTSGAITTRLAMSMSPMRVGWNSSGSCSAARRTA